MTWKKCRMTGLLFGLLLLLLVSLRAGAENPLGFREYEQSVTLRFASPEAAEALIRAKHTFGVTDGTVAVMNIGGRT